MTSKLPDRPLPTRRRQRPISQSDICRLTGLGSSAVSQACRGRLAASRIHEGIHSGDRGATYDANNDAVIRFLAKHQRAEQFALYVDAFAECAGCPIDEVRQETQGRGSLVPAITFDGTIKVTHPAALKFLRAHPFEIDAKYYPTNVPAILQTTEREDREWTDTHPFSQAYGAREDGAIDLRNSKAS